MGMYLVKRLTGAIVVMWAIITITFLLMHAIPGGPFTEEKKLPPQIKASIEATYHWTDRCGNSIRSTWDRLLRVIWDRLINISVAA